MFYINMFNVNTIVINESLKKSKYYKSYSHCLFFLSQQPSQNYFQESLKFLRIFFLRFS